MVGIFTGLGAGFERGSAATLGGGGLLGSSALGRGGEGVFLNAATGNLLLSRQDEFLVGRGPDLAIARTYNSLGNFAHDDNGDLWRQSTDRRVYGLTGTLNTMGSTITRLSGDGSEIVYSYNGSFYLTTEGAGAHDKLVNDNGDWIWTDGATQIREIYKAADAGFISEKIDTDGNKISFTYTSSKLTRVTTQDGSYTEYSWSGSNIVSIATFYTDLATSTAKSLTRTRYAYDGSNRLIQVTVDLTPDDNSVSDGNVYVTSYTYDGSSNRIASISQTDGSSLAIEYTYFAADQTHRVTRLTQVVAGGDTRVTDIAYTDEAGGIRRTEITDPRGQVTKLFSKIATGELTKLIAPPAFAGATPQEIQYTYDSAGNVTQATQVGVGQTSYQYDANGNLTQITDANGNVTTRAYDANNSVALETRTGSSASGASTPLYTRYVYDSENHLRYLISPEGRVTEYRYTGPGQVQWTVEYPAHLYAIGSTVPSEAAMDAWRDGLADRSTIRLTEHVYDARGGLVQSKGYGAASTAGAALTSEGFSRVDFVYSQAGQLLGRNVHGQQSESFVYDGLGRLTASTDLAGGTTTIVFNDGATTTTVTTALGYTTVSTYNKAGELISRTDSGSYVNGGARAYHYDKNGQLRLSVDATPEARKSYILYDKAGRKIADIGHDGQLIEYRYDQGGRLVATAYFHNKLTAAQLTTLADPNSEVELGGGGFPRPAAHAYDIWQWNVYDSGGRVVGQIGGDGSVTAYEYDQAGRLVTTRGYYNKLSAGQIAAYMTAAPAALTLPTADAARDVFVRSFYDRDGRLIGALNGEGHLSRIVYDGAGRKVQEIAYANATQVSLRASGTFDQLLASFSPDAAKDVSSRYVYDGQGLLRFVIDPIGRVSEYVYWQDTQHLASGLVRKSVHYAAALGSLANYNYAAVKTAVAALANAANDRASHQVYNDRGQLAYTVDALGQVAGLVYDAQGRVTKTTRFAATVSLGALGTDAQWKANLDSWAASNGANARITRNYYAARGDLRFVVDPEGYVTRNDYDKEGRLFDQYRFANSIAVSDATTITDVDAANKGSSVVTHYRYDNMGRLQDVHDGNGVRRSMVYYANGQLGYEIVSWDQGADDQWVQHFYDQSGKLTLTRRYVTGAAGSASLGATATLVPSNHRLVSPNGQYAALLTREGELRLYHKGEAIWTNGVREVVSGATYRLVAQSDGNLVIYRDVSGQASVAIWSSNTAGAHSGPTFLEMRDDGNFVFHKGTAPTSQGVIWSTGTTGVVAQDPNASEYVQTTYTYDGLGNLATVKDARNFTTSFTYDKAGRVKTQTNPLSGVTTYEYDAFGRAVKTIDAKGNASFAFFDRLGRVIDAVDAENYVTRTAYTAFGEIASLTRYLNRATNIVSVTTPPTLVPGDTGAVTAFQYDKLGRLTRVTDAEAAYEQYTLNAFGERIEVRNKLGGVALYAYDKLSRAVTETLPVNSVLANGTQQAANVVNTFEYDARGNLTKKIEAFGLAEQRTTLYEYDAGDRLLRIKGDSVSAHAGATAAAANVVPTEHFFYDRRGNVIEKRDANGARTLYWYDKLDRLTHTLSPTGALTRYFYDKTGNLTETRAYATLVALPADAKGLPPAVSGEARVVKYAYDALNRLVETRTPAVKAASYAASLVIVTQDLVTTYEYDALGNVVKTTDANGAHTWSYYDKLGRKLTQIDAGNYRTDWVYDTDANVVSERRYATAGAAPSSTITPPAAPSIHADDRVTTFSYDKMGRRLSETRSAVKVHNGAGAHTTQDATILYLYNALGQVTRKTEATGDQVNYAYDLGGRLITETRAGFTDFNGNAVTPTLEYRYNGLSDLSRLRQLGATGTPERVTTYLYGPGGRLASVTDAEGFVRAYAYDAAGRVVREEYNRINLAGAADEALGYDYDLEGRLIAQGAMRKISGAWTRSSIGALGESIDTALMQYNAFGEVAQRGVNGVYGEHFHYDTAGRLIRTNAGDGVWKYFMYDKAGAQTLMLQTVGADFASAALDTLDEVLALWANPAAIGTTNVAGVIATITKYDARGQAVLVLEPQRQLTGSTSADLRTSRLYNAFGEVIRETNALGHDAGGAPIAAASIEYVYNTMGRLIQTTSPAVEGVGENGKWITGYSGDTPNASSATATTFRPVEHRYYDISGRLVAARDANGHLTRLTLLAGTGYGGSEALATVITHPDAATVTTAYDIHGDARKLTDQLGRITLQSFDKLGRLTQANKPGGLIEYYAYDGLGQRTQHWNSLLGAGNAETMAYDQQGRLLAHVATGGDTTTYAYGWSSSLATAGMATFGGWTQTTTYANGKTLTDKTDAFGRAVQHTDMSSLVSDFTYDKAGRLTQRSGGDALNYTYFNTGRLATMSTTTGGSTRTGTFGYDKIGNLASETLVSAGQQWKNITATYDALGRMITWNEAGSTHVPPASVTYAYDANGNIRRANASYRLLDSQGAYSSFTHQRDQWYRYDSLNRVVTQAGSLQSEAIVRGSTGADIFYNAAGERAYTLMNFWATETVFAPWYNPATGMWEISETEVQFYNTRREDYTYDAAGRLSETRIARGTYNAFTGGSNPPTGPGPKRADFTYDLMGRLTLQRDYENDGTTIAFSRAVTYNAKSQILTDITDTRRSNNVVYRASSSFDYGTGAGYALGSALSVTTGNYQNGNFQNNSLTTNAYAWADGAVQSSIQYKPNASQSTTHTSTFTYATIGGAKQLASVAIADGRPRTVTFRNDLSGQTIRRDEADNLSSGDPHELWYRFGGRQLGAVGNNGSIETSINESNHLDKSYEASIKMRTATPGTGPFRNGSQSAIVNANLDLSLTPINSYTAGGSGGGAYVARGGDTLASIAASLWGDSSLWWKLAEANGLSANAALIEGQSLIVPAGVMKSTHNAGTFRPYDPAEALGDVSPTSPKPPKKNKCGGFGQILLVVIAVVVAAVVTAGAAAAMTGNTFSSMMSAVMNGSLVGAGGAAAGGGVVVGAGTGIAAGAVGGAAGSIVSQGVGVATGIQDKFSWNAVALAAIGGGIGGSGSKLGVGGKSWVAAGLRGMVANAATQGIGVAFGLQSKFSWAGVAAAGVGAAAFHVASGILPGSATAQQGATWSNRFGASMASMLADAGARSLIEGTNFGDNVRAALPNVIGQTIGNAIAGGIAHGAQLQADARLLSESGIESYVRRGQVVSRISVDGEEFESTLPGRAVALASAEGRSRAQLIQDLADADNLAGLRYSALGEYRAGQEPTPRVYVEDADLPSEFPSQPSRDESIFGPLARGVASFGDYARNNQGQAEFGVFAISALSGGPVKKVLSFAVDRMIGGEIDRFETSFERAFATSLAERGVDAGSSLFIASGTLSIGSILLRGNPRNGVTRAIETADRGRAFADMMRAASSSRTAAAGGPTNQELLTASALAAAAAATQSQTQVHGNSYRSQDPTNVYHLVNIATGDIDKIGITNRVDSPTGRYTAAYLASEGVQYQTVWRYQTRYPAVVHENIELVHYYLANGRLPRLNKTFR